jgi:hypothetical protein
VQSSHMHSSCCDMTGLCLPVSYSGSGVAYPGLATVVYVFVPDNSQGTTKVLHALCWGVLSSRKHAVKSKSVQVQSRVPTVPLRRQQAKSASQGYRQGSKIRTVVVKTVSIRCIQIVTSQSLIHIQLQYYSSSPITTVHVAS